eukprot:TRINITY_DN427_c0_g1_i11.p1 TRINITY_DN427_c0_g1~~TRINITY_DN427_c0_g1_i11.p1  ORF type:complete len:539 (+),score=107.40 TRINITY_DN427_c0_g1_i11:49-1665(+)
MSLTSASSNSEEISLSSSEDDAIEQTIYEHDGSSCSPRGMLWLTIVFSSISGLLLGYDIGVITGALVFLDTTFHLSEVEKEAIVSLAFLGAIFGPMIAGPLASAMGRKKLLMLGSLLFMAGACLMAFSPDSMFVIMIGRVVVGLAMGITSLIVPLYIAELSPAEERGMLVSMNEVLIVVGILLSFLINALLSWEFYGWEELPLGNETNTNTTFMNMTLGVNGTNVTTSSWNSKGGAWRWSFGISAIPAFIQFCGIFFLPESPRWLISKGRKEEGLDVLQKTRPNFLDAEKECNKIIESLKFTEEYSTWKYISFIAHDMCCGTSRMPLIMATVVAFIVQFTGQPTVLYYTSTFIQESGLFPGTTQNLLISIVPIVVKLIITIVSTFTVIDQKGRRLPLLGGLGAMCLSLILLAISVGVPSVPSWVVMCGLSIYMAAFALSLGPICWVLYSELFPNHSREIGAALATSIHFGFQMLVSSFFLSFYNLSPPGTFAFYAGIATAGGVFIYFFIPETKGVDLEDIAPRGKDEEITSEEELLED